jgi:hypothetical protein
MLTYPFISTSRKLTINNFYFVVFFITKSFFKLSRGWLGYRYFDGGEAIKGADAAADNAVPGP